MPGAGGGAAGGSIHPAVFSDLPRDQGLGRAKWTDQSYGRRLLARALALVKAADQTA